LYLFIKRIPYRFIFTLRDSPRERKMIQQLGKILLKE